MLRMCSRLPTCGKMGVALSNFTRTHASVSQMVRDDMHVVSGCDAGQQRDKPRRNQATVIVFPNEDARGWCLNIAVQQRLNRVVGRRQFSCLFVAKHMLWVPEGLVVGIVGFALEVRAEFSAKYNLFTCDPLFVEVRCLILSEVRVQHTVKMLMSRLWSVVTFGRCVWARKSRDIQLATFRRHTPATCGCWDRGRLFSLYRILSWCPGYFVSLAMGCVVVTEPFDLTSLVEDTCSPFQIGCKPILAASTSQHGCAHS